MLHLPRDVSLAEAERQLILAALEHHGGDKARCAETLGISLKTLYTRLQTYGLGRNGARIANARPVDGADAARGGGRAAGLTARCAADDCRIAPRSEALPAAPTARPMRQIPHLRHARPCSFAARGLHRWIRCRPGTGRLRRVAHALLLRNSRSSPPEPSFPGRHRAIGLPAERWSIVRGARRIRMSRSR